MSATYRLFERWKASKGYGSDREAALGLRVSHGTPHQWKNGKNGEPEYIERMARDLGEDPIKTILEAYAEQKTGNSQKVLEKLAKRFGAVAIAAILGATAYPAEAKIKEPVYTLCEVSKRRGRYGRRSTHPRSKTRWNRKTHKAEAITCRPACA